MSETPNVPGDVPPDATSKGPPGWAMAVGGAVLGAVVMFGAVRMTDTDHKSTKVEKEDKASANPDLNVDHVPEDAQLLPAELAPDADYAMNKPPMDTPSLLDGLGREPTMSYCAGCHSTTYITMQSPLTADEWQAEVDRMRQVFGAQIPDDRAADIVRYLSDRYTPGNRGLRTPPPVGKPGAKPVKAKPIKGAKDGKEAKTEPTTTVPSDDDVPDNNNAKPTQTDDEKANAALQTPLPHKKH